MLTYNKVIDDLGLDSATSNPSLEGSKLESLKAKLAAKKQEMAPRILAKKTRSISFGFLGSGQCGANLVSYAHQLGYEAVCINTANQDLELIDLPESNKLLLEYGLGGAARDLLIGQAAAEAHKEAIYELVQEKLDDCQVLVFCLSLGGGSGAGSCQTVIDILSTFNKPIIV